MCINSEFLEMFLFMRKQTVLAHVSHTHTKKSQIRIFLRKFRLFVLKFWGTTPPPLPQESVIIYKSHCQVSFLQIKEHLARATSLFPTINCRHSRPASPEPIGADSPESSDVTGMIPDPCTSKSSQSPAKMPL